MGLSNAERQRRYIARLKAAKAEPGKDALAEVAALRERLAAAKARMQEMGLEMAAQAQGFRDEVKRRAANAKPKAAKPPLPPDEARDRRIKALTTEVRTLKAHILHMVEHQAARDAMTGGLPRATQVVIDKVLHPDTRGHATEADKDSASKLWNAWKDTRKGKAR
jgi:hypothetical protein